jgi:membrane protein required for beta-lactamase induction
MDYQQPSRSTEVIAVVVRLLGLVMLIVGLTIAIKTIIEAWSLYEEPQRIERFAEAIDEGSNLDQLLRSFSQKTTSTENEAETATTTSQQATLRVSYFLAWIIALVLLMVIGGLAASAIRTGGQLALYDLQVKRFANELIKQTQKSAAKKD